MEARRFTSTCTSGVNEIVLFSAALGPFGRATRRSPPSFCCWIIESSLATNPPAPAVFAAAKPTRAAAAQGPCGGLSGRPRRVSAGRASVRASPDLREVGSGLGSRGRSPSRRQEKCPSEGLREADGPATLERTVQPPTLTAVPARSPNHALRATPPESGLPFPLAGRR